MRKCEICEYYSKLAQPRKATEECVVHGFCFKDYMKNGMTNTYPVYIPDAHCKWFKRRKGIVEKDHEITGQMQIEDFPEVLP